MCQKFCERILSEANDVSHGGNMLLDTEGINMLVVLRMNRLGLRNPRKKERNESRIHRTHA